MAAHQRYREVVARGRARDDTIFLDIGCCSNVPSQFLWYSVFSLLLIVVGTDVRKLVFDGYPGNRVIATDIQVEYLQLGHKLYEDKDTCPITFFSADIVNLAMPSNIECATVHLDLAKFNIKDVSSFEQLWGRVTHIYTGMLFHLFDEEIQYEIAKRLALLLDRRPSSGAIIFGIHEGREPAGRIENFTSRDRLVLLKFPDLCPNYLRSTFIIIVTIAKHPLRTLTLKLDAFVVFCFR